MKRSVSHLLGYGIRAVDGRLGVVDGFCFDDGVWTVRYLIANTNPWLAGRKVLLSTSALKQPDWESGTFPVNLTKDQVRHSPNINTAKPVSRQHETQLHQYYEWPIYWPLGLEAHAEADPAKEKENPHLRSTRVVTGYHIQAADGEIGHVEDFIIDDETWNICYLVVNTHNWLPGKKVLIAPQWIERVSWSKSKVFVKLSVESVKESPPYDPAKPVSRDYEGRLFDYYGRPKYWEHDLVTDPPHYPCRRCGRKFLSQLELRAHRKLCRPGKKAKRHGSEQARPVASIIDKIEELRPEPWGGYRETDRSS